MGREKTAPAGTGRNAGENIDEASDEPEECGFDCGRCAAEYEHGDERHPRLADIEPDEAERSRRRLKICARAERIDPGLEQAEDGSQKHGSDIGGLGGAAKGMKSGRNLIFL
ncbi:hypothetical protein RHECNPAF_900015 [Rhizobium etli CNPAF512]|nr:hypothetical protein RHECNPAF_900015 [Rhizobium etli CNPAF512]